jgi:hypothetical protein
MTTLSDADGFPAGTLMSYTSVTSEVVDHIGVAPAG